MSRRTLEAAAAEAAARSGFTGAVRVEREGETVLDAAYGLADRSHAVANTVGTLFATASGTKTLTALTVMALIERGLLDLRTSARSLLGTDLPLISGEVTVEHLLAHRSGIGDYLDEDALEDAIDYVMPVPVHQLCSTEDYLPVLDGHPLVFEPGTRFTYNNGGYVVLALLAERAAGTAFPDLVRTLVCEPAGMVDTRFLRSDELSGRAARGYLYAEGLRTNVLHLPVLGSGDGGIYTTTADCSAFWNSLFEGRIVSRDHVEDMVRPQSDWPEEDRRYGLGFHLGATSDTVWLEGSDAGVSFASVHRPSTSVTYSVLANWTAGAWPMVTMLAERLSP